MNSKRDVALQLTGELLSDIELGRIKPIDIARRALRLARLTDDNEAMLWIYYEVSGYPETGPLDQLAWKAALKSNRVYKKEENQYARTAGLGQLQASIDSAEKQLAVSGSGNYFERGQLRKEMVENQAILDRIIGSLHIYTNRKFQELRFGAAVETVFDSLRSRVDSQISDLVPEALPILTTALENANDDNPIQWENAAKACRDLIKATADALRPPGPQKDGRAMTDANYVNRLMDWIGTNSKSKTLSNILTSDLEDLGKRLDAVTTGGHKGAHTKIKKEDASRYIVGTYLLLGDILALKNSAVVNSVTEATQNPQLGSGALLKKTEANKQITRKQKESKKE